MRKYIMGFSQARLIELGVNLTQAAILRWFIDFKDTDRMKRIIVEDKPFYWISYKKVADDNPLLGIKSDGSYKEPSRDTIYRHFQKLVKAGILEMVCIKEQTFFATGKVYKTLVAEDTDLNEKAEKKLQKGARKDKALGKKLEGSEENPKHLGEKSEQASEKIPTYRGLSNRELIIENIEEEKTAAQADPDPDIFVTQILDLYTRLKLKPYEIPPVHLIRSAVKKYGLPKVSRALEKASMNPWVIRNKSIDDVFDHVFIREALNGKWDLKERGVKAGLGAKDDESVEEWLNS